MGLSNYVVKTGRQVLKILSFVLFGRLGERTIFLEATSETIACPLELS